MSDNTEFTDSLRRGMTKINETPTYQVHTVHLFSRHRETNELLYPDPIVQFWQRMGKTGVMLLIHTETLEADNAP